MNCIAAILVLLHSLPFTNSLIIEVVRVAIGWWNQLFYLLFQSEAGFSTFYIWLLFPYTPGMGEYCIITGSHWL